MTFLRRTLLALIAVGIFVSPQTAVADSGDFQVAKRVDDHVHIEFGKMTGACYRQGPARAGPPKGAIWTNNALQVTVHLTHNGRPGCDRIPRSQGHLWKFKVKDLTGYKFLLVHVVRDRGPNIATVFKIHT